jgi:hypothetical protein
VNDKERMMRDYPNMSYCMVSNTLAALEQIMTAMDDEGDVAFLKDLNRDEMRAFDELKYVARQFSRRAERAQDQSIDENVDEILAAE